jgi:hypothetical protein
LKIPLLAGQALALGARIQPESLTQGTHRDVTVAIFEVGGGNFFTSEDNFALPFGSKGGHFIRHSMTFHGEKSYEK